ncbi:MAG: purine-nucleoside phosphorylase [Candidatus Sericytochromatia bacterium]
MKTAYTLEQVFEPARQARDSLFSQTKLRPEVAIVLGSGIAIFEDLEQMEVIPFGDITGFPQASVKGHKGEVTLGYLDGKCVAIFRGRLHRYEGHPWRHVVFPITLMHEMGIETVIMTNSAGGLDYYLTPGDLVLIRDYLYYQPVSQEERTCLYLQAGARQYPEFNPALLGMAHEAAQAAGVHLRHGTYMSLLGPTYETPAELRFFSRMGADVVGMSTIPEAMWAQALKMQTLCISCVTNVTHTVQALAQTSHEEVVEVAQQASLRLEAVLKGLLQRL